MDGQRGRRTAPAGRISHLVCDLSSDFSDVSSEASKMEEMRNLGTCSRLLSTRPGQSRFLKRAQTRSERHLLPKEGPVPGGSSRLTPGGPAAPASKVRADAALSRLARLETRILRRRARPGSPASGSGASTPEDSPAERAGGTRPGNSGGLSSQSTDRTSQKHAPGVPEPERDGRTGRASRFLKRKEPPVAASPAACPGTESDVPLPTTKEPSRMLDSPDSDEEEMKVLLGSLMDSPREKAARTNQGSASANTSKRARAKGFLEQLPARPSVLSLPGEELSSTRLSRPSRPPRLPSADRTLPSPGSRTPSPPAGPRSRSAPATEGHFTPVYSPGRSEAVPWDATASETSGDSLEDFRINILSLDDLPPAAGESSELDPQEEGAQWEKPSSPGSGGEAPSGLGAPGQAQERSSEAGAEAPSTESEVSELLSGRPASSRGSASSRSSASGDPTASTVSSAYSEDFESSPSPTASEPGGRFKASPDGALETLSEFSSSLKRDLSSRPPRPCAKGGRHAPRVTVKETAVQTLDPAFSYQWASAAGVAALGPSLGDTYMDPTPIASHVISADAIEALTAYSPAACALNELLRQQLSLTQQFVESSRQLHGSALRALDEDSFHYHSLEEAQEYIRHHRPAPLTLEDALEQVRGSHGEGQSAAAWGFPSPEVDGHVSADGETDAQGVTELEPPLSPDTGEELRPQPHTPSVGPPPKPEHPADGKAQRVLGKVFI